MSRRVKYKSRRDRWPAHLDGSTERLELVVEGAVQSMLVDSAVAGRIDWGYWSAMLPSVAPSKTLLLGLGGGTIAHLLTMRFGLRPIIAVDNDPQVIAIGRERFGLNELDLTIIEQDAILFVEECTDRFNFIAVDLYRGPQLERGVLSKPFLRHLRRILMPGGTIAINLMREKHLERQVARIDRYLGPLDRTDVGLNRVLKCRPARR